MKACRVALRCLPVNAILVVELLALGRELIRDDITNLLEVAEALLKRINGGTLCSSSQLAPSLAEICSMCFRKRYRKFVF